MKLRKYKKKNIVNYISISLLLVIISLICSLYIIDILSNNANEILFPMAESQVRKAVAMIINSACDEVVVENKLYTVNRNDSGEIQLISYNSFEATKFINSVTLRIEKKLMDIENNVIDYYGNSGEKGIISEIPFGVIFGNTLLNNIGPKIKIKLDILGDVLSNIETEVKPYGMNNSYIEMRVRLEVTARIVLPFVTEKVVITQLVPISMEVVQGNVPNGYISSYK